MQMQGANRHAVHSVFEDEDVVIKFLCLFMHIFNFKCFQVHGLSDVRRAGAHAHSRYRCLASCLKPKNRPKSNKQLLNIMSNH